MNPAPQSVFVVVLSLGVAGSLLAAILSWLGTRFHRRSEVRKWRADFYIHPKLDALRKMHEATVKAHYGINMRAAATSLPASLDEYRTTVEALERDFFEAFSLAAVYLDESQAVVMSEFLGCVHQMSTSIWSRLPGSKRATEEPEFRAFYLSYSRAHTLLTGLLNPRQLLEDLEE